MHIVLKSLHSNKKFSNTCDYSSLKTCMLADLNECVMPHVSSKSIDPNSSKGGHHHRCIIIQHTRTTAIYGLC